MSEQHKLHESAAGPNKIGYRWSDGLLGHDEPDPVGHLRPDGASPFLLLCDHAGQRIPASLGSLGVSQTDLDRHIAYDIGALGVSNCLSERLDAELIYQRYSRLVIDCNRPPHNPTAFRSVAARRAGQ